MKYSPITTKLTRAVVAVLGVACIALLAGCQCPPTSSAKAPKKARSQKTMTEVCAEVVTQDGKTLVRQAFPTGDARSSLVLLESSSPAEAMVGAEFEYALDVTNLTDCTLYDVTVTEELTDAYQLKASNPQGQMSGQTVTWDLGTLGPRETKTITARLEATEAGEFEHCAMVDYELRMCQTTVVVAPNLEVSKSLPESALLCETIPLTIEVTNSGTGTVSDVTVTDELPDGLSTMEGQSTVRFTVPELSAGQTVTRTFNLKASQTGTFNNEVVAESASGLSDDAADSLRVRQPVLTLEKTATESQFAGRMIDYELTVGNAGDAPAKDLRVVDTLPRGVQFQSASHGGAYDQDNHQIVWNLSALAPEQSRTLTAEVKSTTQGVQHNRAKAMAVCAEGANAAAATDVTGVPAVLLEVVDVDDPIEVGSIETYKIVVTNQGSAVDTDIRITAELEDSQSFVSAEGATDVVKTGQEVSFKALAELGPKEQAVWYVRAKAERVADVRFSVKMTTGQLGDRPVRETEATNQY